MRIVANALKATQLIASVAMALSGLSILVKLAVWDASLRSVNDPPSRASNWVLPFLIVVAPGLLVAIGTYLQTLRGHTWAIGLVLLAGICNVVLVNLNAGLWYVFVQHVWWQRVILADGVALVVTLGAAVTNLALKTMLKSLDASRGSVFRMKLL